jgi:hypothetical protein
MVAWRVICLGCSRPIWEGTKPYNDYIAEMNAAWRAHRLSCTKFQRP